jgi:hypothetical protein
LAIRSPGPAHRCWLCPGWIEGVLVLFVGDDWAEDHHDVEFVDEPGRRLARARLPEGLAGLSRLHGLIAEYVPEEWADLPAEEAARRVVIGIETDRGPWVRALIAAGYVVFAITLPHRHQPAHPHRRLLASRRALHPPRHRRPDHHPTQGRRIVTERYTIPADLRAARRTTDTRTSRRSKESQRAPSTGPSTPEATTPGAA